MLTVQLTDGVHVGGEGVFLAQLGTMKHHEVATLARTITALGERVEPIRERPWRGFGSGVRLVLALRIKDASHRAN